MGSSTSSRLCSHDNLVGAGLIVVLAMAGTLFWPAIHGPFLFDDFANLQHLALLGQQPDLAAIGRYLHAFVGNPGRPIGALSFLIDDQTWPATATSFKRTNLLLHLLTGICIFSFARSLLRLDPSIARRAGMVALATTTLWLLSPMQLAATMLVVQRMNILSALFIVVGLIGYVSTLRNGRPWLALATLWGMSGLAFLSKENGILAFAYAVVLNHTLLRREISAHPGYVGTVANAGTVLPLVFVAGGMWLQSDQLLASYQLREFSLVERLMTEPRILLEYLARILVPRLGGQGIFHDDYVFSTGLLQPLTTLPAIVVCIGAVVTGALLRARSPWVAFAILWFFAGHLLESTFLPLELYFEHRNYLPMLGPILSVTALAARLSRFWLRIAAMVFGLWLAVASFSVWLNARAWGDELLLARVWHSENPDSVRSTQLLARILDRRGRPDLARQVLSTAYRKQPERTELAFQIALVDCTADRLRPEDIQDLQQLSRSAKPVQSTDAAVRKLSILAMSGACSMTTEDWGRVADNLLANPSYARVGSLAGSLHYQKGVMAERARDLDAAMLEYDNAYRYLRDPRIPQRQAVLLASAGLADEALDYLAISDKTPVPAFKQFLFDPKQENEKIRRVIEASPDMKVQR